MGLVARQRVLALAIDQHLRGAIGRVTAEREGEFVMIIEGEADRVEAGARLALVAGTRTLTCVQIGSMIP